MGGFFVFAIMLLGAFIPFGLVGYLVRIGKNGLALTFVSLIGGLLVLLVYASDGSLGMHPLMAMSWAMVFMLPAFIGSLAGWLLGWLIRRRGERSD